MTFISYAQNFEDVILWRALKDMKDGFYIDIGANDPVNDSVTKAMYDLGWRGINCEPVEHWFKKLEKERINDINLQVAIGEKNTELEFYEVVNTGLSTLNKETAYAHAENLGYKVKNYPVPVKTLTEICQKNKVKTIHFLKIDVEGSEKSVLAGIDFKITRPWIVLIEATKPMSQNIDYQEWEYLITSQNYHFVYFDGLNRFYIANEHSELDQSFNTPPNVFDRFILSSEVDAKNESNKWWETADEATKWAQDNEQKYLQAIEERDKWWETADEATKWAQDNEQKYLQAIEERDKWWQTADDATKWAQENEKKLQRTQILLDKSATSIDQLATQYDIILHSTSWKVTKPLRFIFGKIKSFLGRK